MVLYQCAICNFETNIITHFNRHKNTKKHIRNMELKKTKNEKKLRSEKIYFSLPKMRERQKLPQFTSSISLNFPQFTSKFQKKGNAQFSSANIVENNFHGKII